MKNHYSLFSAMLIAVIFVGCDDADKRALEIIEERERAQAFAKLELELAELKRDAAAKERSVADRQAADKQSELAGEQAKAEALAAAAREAQIAAERAKAAADASRNIGQAQDAAVKAQQAAQSALLAAKQAEELNNKLRLELARVKAEASSKSKYYPVPPNPYTPPIPGGTVIGAFGGTVRSPGGSGATIYVPPGSLKAGVPITVNVVPPPPQIAGLAPLCAVSFTPSGTTFNPPAVVTFPLPRPLRPGSPVLLTYWDAAKQVYQYPNPKVWARVSFKNPRFATARVSHFSTVVLCETGEIPPGWDQRVPQGHEDNVPAPDNFPVDPIVIPRDDGGIVPHDGRHDRLPDGTYPGGTTPSWPGRDGGVPDRSPTPYNPDSPYPPGEDGGVPDRSPKDFEKPYNPDSPYPPGGDGGVPDRSPKDFEKPYNPDSPYPSGGDGGVPDRSPRDFEKPDQPEGGPPSQQGGGFAP